MNKAIYIPAIGEQFVSVWKRGLNYKNFDIKFFTDKSHFKYMYGLQSMYYGINNSSLKDENNYKNLIGFEKGLLISDSGGFQLATFKKGNKCCDINVLDSLRWQEKNADIMMELDFPPNLDGNFSYDEFVWALNESVKNFEIFDKNRKNFDAKLYNVIHGQNTKYLQMWYDKVKHFKTDGWAIGVKPAFDPLLQALAFMVLYENGEFDKDTCKGLHFFGTSGKHVVPTIAYIAQKLKVLVTYDSSSYNTGSIYRTYYLPYDIGPNLSFGDNFKRDNPHLKMLPCKCPVCSSIDDINILNTKEIYSGTLISLHNMYQYIQYNDIINSLVVDKELFLDYLNKIDISQKTLISIEFIDFAMEKGLNNALDKYKYAFDDQTIIRCKQKSIFGF
jgi:tRNA-guanine family transglycosylase